MVVSRLKKRKAQSTLPHGASTPPQGASTLPHGASTPPQGESTLPHGASSLRGARYPLDQGAGVQMFFYPANREGPRVNVSCPTIGDEAAKGGEGCLHLEECLRLECSCCRNALLLGQGTHGVRLSPKLDGSLSSSETLLSGHGV